MVLPITANINNANHLEIGGCDTVELAKKFGTPLFVYDEESVLARCRAYKAAFSDGPTRVEVIYAAKAFLCLAFARLIADEGLSIDVSSGGELFVALKAGFPIERIYLHGNNKTPAELEMALKNNIGWIVVDSLTELAALDRLAAATGRRQRIFLRLTPGIKPQTHRYIQTGQVDSKFGFGIEDGSAKQAIERALAAKHLELVGFHAHIGSQIFVLDSYAKSIEILVDFIAAIQKTTHFFPAKLNIGGGLGIRYVATDEPASIADYAGVVFDAVAAAGKKRGLALPELAIEPGRSIAGSSCVTLYRIGTIKEVPGVRTYVSVDGGMSDNLRPMLYGAVYEALLANKAGDQPAMTVTIAGKHCESGDILIKDIELPKLEIGDILCTPATGAYGYAMANNFNLQPRPAVVMVKDGRARMIIKRESYEDLIRNQVYE
ncbi:MAG: diaminopimelate decarboxylase [Actinomycetota bacterium]|nr:diaminopimelate decarboxylase [Actinomycetota bacterium]